MPWSPRLRPTPLRRPRRLARGAALGAIVALGVAATPASAALTLDKSAPPRVLLGNESTVTLRATNDGTGPYGYNLSFRDVLPAGVSYVPGSAKFGDIEIDPTVIANAPAAGQTTLIFENVSDISVNASQSVTYRVAHQTSGSGALAIGDAYVNTATAYANQQPRIVPAFTATGAPVASATGMTSSTAQASTEVAAIKIEKSEPNSEGEIMRGVHDHQTVYTLRVTNNGINPTTGITVDDYLPAGLEFLGCGTEDNTTSAGTNLGSDEEYDGAGAIDAPGNAPSGLDASKCRTPAIVETVQTDPDGAGNPMPNAVYTHVRWTGLGTLQPGETIELQYVAAVPLRENTMSWSTATAPNGGTAPATDGPQTANLDNNSGPETRDEQRLTNYAVAGGVYRGDDPNPALRLPVTDETTLDRTAEDLAVAKSVDPDEIVQNGISEWTLLFRTSEYRRVTGGVATDTLPNGLCPLGAQNLEQTPPAANAECNPVSGQTPSLSYSSVVENTDGSWTLTWNLPDLAPSAEYELTFPTRTRRHYQENFADDTANPVRAGDSWTNSIDVTGDDHRICTGGDADCTGSGERIDGDGPDSRTVIDESSASQTSGGVTIDKTVLDPTATGVPTPVSCTAAQTANPDAYVDAPTVPTYGAGDRICWRLRVDFSSSVDTGEPVIRDFIPAGMTYEAGSAVPTDRNTLGGVTVDDSGAAADRVLSWSLADVDTSNQIFEWTFSTIATPAVMPVGAEQTITGNLMKLAYRNTGGETFSLRDRVEAQVVKPVVGLVKDVTAVTPLGGGSISGGNATNVPVGSAVNYRVRLSNGGDETARRTVVWDNLPVGITCADVAPASISDGGVCAVVPMTSQYRITWDAADAITVPANGTKDLTYTVTVPQGLPPAAGLTNTAGVVEYERDTNLGGGDAETFVPASNIDPTRTVTNAPRADDPATITLRDVAVAKTVTGTSVTGTGNSATTQATIGETIDYRVTITVPAGTTLFGTPQLADLVNDRMTLLPGASVSRSGGAAPAGGEPTVNPSGNALEVNFAGSYANTGTTDAVFTVTFSTRVNDATTPTNANRRGQTLPNTAGFSWQASSSSPTLTTKTANAPNVTIVEPNLTTSKRVARSPYTNETSLVAAGDVLMYSVEVRNDSGTNVAPSHDTRMVDTVPVGLTPQNVDGDPAQDGDEIGVTPGSGQNGVWNAAARTITWSTIGTLPPGNTTQPQYYARVDSPAPAGAVYTNSVTATGTSLAGSDANERTSTSGYNTGYTSTSPRSVTVEGGTLTKTAVSPRATIGDLIDYTVEYTLPADVTFYDLLVNDYLPNGVDYVPGSAQTSCLPACTFTGTAASPNELSSPRSVSSGQGQHGWFLDDVAAAPTARTLRITYQGRINADYYLPSTAAVKAGDVLTNSVSVQYNATNKLTGPLTGFPNPNNYDQRTDPETASVTVKEPRITLDKHVSGIPVGDDSDRRSTEPGDSYTYTVKVTNTGTSPAYDLDITDTPSDKLTNVVANAAGVSPSGSATVVDGNGDDGALQWHVAGPLAPGDTITLTYTADLADSSELSANETVVNTARVPSYWNASETERDNDPDDGFREYTANPPSDTVTLDVRLPNVTVSKTTGGPGFPEAASAEIGESFPWRVLITNPSPSSTAYDVEIADVLPAGWTYDEDSAAFAPAPSVPGFDAEPTVTTMATGDALNWANIGDIAPGGQVVLTFTATPGLVSRPNANPQRNVAAAAARDSDGQSGSADGPYADDDTADANLRLPVLTVAKTPDGANAIAGTTNSYSIVVRNTATNGAPARDVEVTDVLQAHQSYVAGTATASPATGFSEVAPVVDEGDEDDPADDTTTIGWKIASIPAGGSVTITVPVRVPADLAGGTTLRNGVSVESREVTTPVTDEGSLLSSVRTDVGIVKTVTAPTTNAVPGENITYELVATNHGPSVATGVVVSDMLPSSLTLVSAPGCTVDEDDERDLTCNAGTLGVGDSQTFTVTAKVAASATGTISNTAIVASTTSDENHSNNSSTAPKSLSPDADLVVTKDVSKASVLQGERFSYEITVRNAGPSDATAVTLDDTLPAGVVLVTTGTGTDTGTCTPTTATNSVSCALGTLTPGQTATITVVAEAEDVGTFKNVATAETDTAETTTTNNEDDADVTVGPVANVGIEKTAAETVDANANLTYTLRLFNDGPSPATNVVVEDELPAGVVFVSASAGCTEADGTVTCTRPTLAVSGDPADDPTYEITVQVPWALADTTLSNTATISADEDDQTPTDDESTAGTEVGPAANLKTVKTAPTLPVAQSVEYEYEVTVENQGPSTAVGATLSDPMPAGVTAIGATSDVGTCTVTANVVNCAFGDLAKDASAKVTITARGDQPGTPNNVATASSDTPEVDDSDNEDNAEVEILAASDVAIVKSAPATAEANSLLTYTLEITNNGPSDATNVTVTDNLPPNVDFRSADAGCTTASGTITCVVGDLAAGDTVERKITVFVPYAIGGQSLTNIASVTATEVDLVPENNSSRVTTVVGDVADLVVTKTAGGAVAGGQATWTVTVRNDGPTAAKAVKLVDQLPEGTSFRSALPSVGTCGGSGRDVSCELGTIEAGGSAQITIVADVAASATGQQLRNAATASSTTADPDETNNTGTADVVVSPAPPTNPDLHVTKVASTAKPELGKAMEYRIEVTNRGQVTANDVRLTDTMSTNVVVGKVRATQGRCDAAKSTVDCRLGAIAPGQKVTVVVPVTPITAGALSNTVSVAAEGQSDEQILDNRAVANVRVEAKRAAATITKKASRKAVKGGKTVTYTISVKMGKRAGSNLRVCDRLPHGLSFVRATGATFRKGQACWTIPYLGANKRKTLRIVARTDRSDRTRTVRNTAVLTGRNVARRKAAATVRVSPALARPGGVTG
jgi:uncharacterized repeat protein (TIGR01451 family)/fimbrial isopeptide formation D2 family protein